MKRALCILLAVLTLSAGGVCAAFGTLYRQRDQVVIEQEVLYGDLSAAEDLRITASARCGGNLFWSTTVRPGQEPEVDTSFTFSYESLDKRAAAGSGNYLRVGNAHSWYSTQVYGEDAVGIGKAIQELEQSLGPWEEGERTVLLKDYYDVYPLSIEAGFSGAHIDWDSRQGMLWESMEEKWEEEVRYIADFFTIPVLEDETVHFAVEKRENGIYSSSVGSGSEGDSFHLGMSCVDGGDAFYLTFDNATTDGNRVDTSQIPGGYGIYRLPYREGTDEASAELLVEELAMVYPLEEDGILRDLSITHDGKQLLLYTLEEGWFTMTVIDRATMEKRQCFRLVEKPKGRDVGWAFRENENFIVHEIDNELIVLSRDENGLFREDFRVSSALGNVDLLSWYRHSEEYYDGERLVFLNDIPQKTEERWYAGCSFRVLVYDKTGLRYCGDYHSSLNVGYGAEGDMLGDCTLYYYDPFKLEWLN